MMVKSHLRPSLTKKKKKKTRQERSRYRVSGFLGMNHVVAFGTFLELDHRPDGRITRYAGNPHIYSKERELGSWISDCISKD